MVDALVGEFVLYRRHSGARLAIAFFLGLLILAVQVLLIAYLEMDSLEPEALRAFAYRIYERMAQKPLPYVLFAVGIIAVAIYMVSQIVINRKSRLLIDASGIRYQSPQPSWLKGLYSSWTMNWTDVRAIRVAPSIFDTIPGSTLTIDGVSQRRKLWVYDWVDARHRNQPLDKALRARRRIKPQVLTRVLEQQSLMKCLRALGIQVDIQVGVAAPPSRGFDLGSNRHAVFALVLLAALAAYAAIAVMLPGQPVSWNMPLLVASAGAGILIAITFGIWLHKAGVPVVESVVIAVSLGSASGAVLYLSLRDIIW